MIDTKIKEQFLEMANTRRYSETMIANQLGISVSSVRKFKKEYSTPDYDPNIRKDELKKIIRTSKSKGTDLAFNLGISYSLLTKLKSEIESEKVVKC